MDKGLRNYKCLTCCQAFGTKDSQRPSTHVTRWPLLLNCGHAFCEGCLNKRAKQELTAICCPTCRIQTPLKEGLASVAKLPMDVYLLGQLFLHKSRHAVKQVGMDFMKVNPELLKKKGDGKASAKKELCGECSIRQATCKCTKCECSMCQFCFDTIHKSSKILRKHQAIPLYEDESLAPIPAACILHDNRPIEYYCEDDNKTICSHCVVVGIHQNHNVTPLETKNREAIEDLELAVRNSGIVLHVLHKSERNLASVHTDTRQNMLNIREELQQHFHRLHGLLQAREMELLEELGDIFKNEIDPLDKTRFSLREQIAKVESTLKDTEKAMNNQQHLVVNAQQVLARLQGIQSMPCHVQYTRSDTHPISFEIDEQVAKSLESVVAIDANPFGKFEFLSMKEAPEGVYDDDLDSISTTSTRTSLSRSTSWADHMSEDSSDTSSVLSTLLEASDSLREKRRNNKKKSYKKKKINRRQQKQTWSNHKLSDVTIGPKTHQECFFNTTTVQVTHIKNPCSFMVQRVEDAIELQRLSVKLQSYCATSEDPPPDIVEDCPVLAKFSTDESWYRAEIRSIVVDDPDPDAAKVEIIYVDYGNTEVVPVSRLRKITPQFLKLPSLAIHAALVDIISADQSGQWTLDAVHSFAEMTNEKPMLMHVVQETATGQVMVDLCKPVGDDGADNRPVSVRDALVFLEYAIFVSSPVCATGPPRPFKRYIAAPMLNCGDVLQCIMSHVDSPYNFYIQKSGDDAHILISLMANLQQVYGQDDKQLWSVFYPQLDLVCIAQYELDNQWYRAQVVGVPGRCNVDVLYVDFGNTARVSHSKLRCTRQSFLILPKQAIHCSLADVAPVGGAGWPTEAIARFNSFNFAELSVIVTDVVGRQVFVALSTPDGICINYQLVEDGLAISTGPASQKPIMPKSLSALQAKGSQSKKESYKVGVTYQTKKETKPKETLPQKDCAAVMEGLDDPNRAIVTHIVHPGHLYVQLLSAPEDGLHELMANLQKMFSNAPRSNKQWNIDDHCAVKRDKDGKWYRGKIIDKGSEPDSFRVKFLDYGYDVEAPAAGLQPAPPTEYPQFSLCCNLRGVQPAGDPTRWSRTATEYLTKITEDKIVRIDPKGPVEDGCMPCDLLVEKRIDGDALNPDRMEYPSITDMLMNHGVALPNRRLTRQSSGPQITVQPKPIAVTQTAATVQASVSSNAKPEPKSIITKDDLVEKQPIPSMQSSEEDEASRDQQKILVSSVQIGKVEAKPEVVEKRSSSNSSVEKECEKRSDAPIQQNSDTAAIDLRLTRQSSGPQITVQPKPIAVTQSAATVQASVSSDAKPEPESTITKECEKRSDAPIQQKSDTAPTQENIPTSNVDADAGGEPGHTESVAARNESVAARNKTVHIVTDNTDFPPPVLPTQDRLTVVPTYIDWNMVVYVQEVKADEDKEGRFGFFLKENTLETIIQDRYLQRRGLHRARIPRDGNCLFRAFTQVLYADQGYQGQLRQTVVAHLERNWDSLVDCFGEQDKDLYLSKMRQDKQYAGEPEIQAICKEFSVSVELCMGGLSHPVQVRCYNTESGAETVVRLIYVADGNIDSGHYDLAVETLEEVANIDSVYYLYRSRKIDELKEWPMYHDNTLYDDSLLDQLMGQLRDHYADSVPDPTANWLVGQSVVARCTQDEAFYRACISRIDNKGIYVQYIDFGDGEYVSLERLRKDIILTEIPQQCFRCVAQGVTGKSKGGGWTKAVLDYAHKLFVNQQCDLEVLERPTSGDLLTVKLILPDGRDLASLLLEMQVAASSDAPETRSKSPTPLPVLPAEEEFGEHIQRVVIPEELQIPDRQVPSPYTPMFMPEVGEVFGLTITQVNTPSEVYFAHVSPDDDFLLVDTAINADNQLYDPLTFVKPGMACCGEFNLDKRWYRGEILTVERRGGQTMAGVLFVDYGSFQWISSDDLRAIPENLMDLRVQSALAQITGLAPPPGQDWSALAFKIARESYITAEYHVGKLLSVEPVIEIQFHSREVYEAKHKLGPQISQSLVDADVAVWLGRVSEDGTVVENEEEDEEGSDILVDAEELERQRLAALEAEVD